ncbi:MAG TPA: hypothetical protein PL163_11945 [Leptospiraceae bacterium]|nr:hypothetical protein [Leptospiraceae bacterium]
MVCAFASNEESEVWSEEGKERVKEDVEKSWNWIVDKVSQYGTEVFPETEFLNEDEVVDFIPDADSKKGNLVDPFVSIIQKLDYDSATDFYESVKEESGNTHFIFFVNKNGRSFKSTLNINHADLSLEINVVFLCDATTIIYETLHAYGAVDLYNVNGTPEEEKVENYTAENFPNEVMLCSASMEEPDISGFNAFMVGWHREHDDWFFDMVTEESRSWLQEMIDNVENFDEDGNLIIDTMEEVAVYTSEDGKEFHRYQINGTESIYLWREYGQDDDKDAEGKEYQEFFLYDED